MRMTYPTMCANYRDTLSFYNPSSMHDIFVFTMRWVWQQTDQMRSYWSWRVTTLAPAWPQLDMRSCWSKYSTFPLQDDAIETQWRLLMQIWSGYIGEGERGGFGGEKEQPIPHTKTSNNHTRWVLFPYFLLDTLKLTILIVFLLFLFLLLLLLLLQLLHLRRSRRRKMKWEGERRSR